MQATVRALLVAVGACIACHLVPGLVLRGSLSSVFMSLYLGLFYLGAAFFFVYPVFVLFPASRTPGPRTAAAWGALLAMSLLHAMGLGRGWPLFLCLGAVGGLAYSFAIRYGLRGRPPAEVRASGRAGVTGT